MKDSYAGGFRDLTNAMLPLVKRSSGDVVTANAYKNTKKLLFAICSLPKGHLEPLPKNRTSYFYQSWLCMGEWASAQHAYAVFHLGQLKN